MSSGVSHVEDQWGYVTAEGFCGEFFTYCCFSALLSWLLVKTPPLFICQKVGEIMSAVSQSLPWRPLQGKGSLDHLWATWSVWMCMALPRSCPNKQKGKKQTKIRNFRKQQKGYDNGAVGKSGYEEKWKPWVNGRIGQVTRHGIGTGSHHLLWALSQAKKHPGNPEGVPFHCECCVLRSPGRTLIKQKQKQKPIITPDDLPSFYC